MTAIRKTDRRERPCIYLVGALANPEVVQLGNAIRRLGFDCFDDWFSAGPEADVKWREYEQARGRHHADALAGHHAKDVFDFDVAHLDRCVGAVLLMPAGKSGHLEFGYITGQKKPGFILFDEEPERFDIMHRFAFKNGGGIHYSRRTLLAALRKLRTKRGRGVLRERPARVSKNRKASRRARASK